MIISICSSVLIMATDSKTVDPSAVYRMKDKKKLST